MKKFTENTDEKVMQYAGDQKIYNKLYDIIDETLTPKMDGEDSEKVSLVGKDELVKELSKIVENEITKTKISVLETFKTNPKTIQPIIEKKDDLSELVMETMKVNEYYYFSDYDLTPEELKDKHGITTDDYAKAGEICMKFLEDYNEDIVDKVDVCTKILDNQMDGEKFSDTLNRLGLLNESKDGEAVKTDKI